MATLGDPDIALDSLQSFELPLLRSASALIIRAVRLPFVELSILFHVIRQSNQVSVRRQVLDADGHFVEVAPPTELPRAR